MGIVQVQVTDATIAILFLRWLRKRASSFDASMREVHVTMHCRMCLSYEACSYRNTKLASAHDGLPHFNCRKEADTRLCATLVKSGNRVVGYNVLPISSAGVDY